MKRPISFALFTAFSLATAVFAAGATQAQTQPQLSALPKEQITPPMPVGSSGEWLKVAEFPKFAMWNLLSGWVEVAIDVSPDGKPIGCTPTKVVGDERFGPATCQALLKNARLSPARNADGNPAFGVYRDRVWWNNHVVQTVSQETEIWHDVSRNVETLPNGHPSQAIVELAIAVDKTGKVSTCAPTDSGISDELFKMACDTAKDANWTIVSTADGVPHPSIQQATVLLLAMPSVASGYMIPPRPIGIEDWAKSSVLMKNGFYSGEWWAIFDRESSAVGVQMTVDDMGKAVGCKALLADYRPTLDKAVCGMFLEQAKFDAARDSSGAARYGVYNFNFALRLGSRGTAIRKAFSNLALELDDLPDDLPSPTAVHLALAVDTEGKPLACDLVDEADNRILLATACTQALKRRWPIARSEGGKAYASIQDVIVLFVEAED